VRLAAGVFGATAAVVAVAAALHGSGGVRADILAAGAAIALGAAAGAGLWGIAAADLAGVLALPSRAGVLAALAVLAGLALTQRRNVVPALLAALAVGIAWLAGAPPARAPFVHGEWRHESGFADCYHRLGAAGLVLFALLLVALLAELPRPLVPAAAGVLAAAAFAPLEATAPVWLLVGLAAGGRAYDRAMASARDRRYLQIERTLEAELREVDAERRRLVARRAALDEHETAVAGRERVLDAREEELARRATDAAAFERELGKRVAALEAAAAALSQVPGRAGPPPPPPAPAPAAAPLQVAPGSWSVPALEALVAARLPEFPERAAEWRGYLALLHEHAADGVLPESFDPLVRDVFKPILGDSR
jgi:hypothetical protein